jgi:hypothetical protein
LPLTVIFMPQGLQPYILFRNTLQTIKQSLSNLRK